MNNPFKYISLSEIQDYESTLIYVITEDMIQQFAEDNLGRHLTKEEVANLQDGFEKNDYQLCRFMDTAIEHAIKAAEITK